MKSEKGGVGGAKGAVIPQIKPTVIKAGGPPKKRGWAGARRSPPAVTMVAAWMSALTGVGPSIASGNHIYNGNCADLAAHATKSSKQTTVVTPLEDAWLKTPTPFALAK